MTCCMLPCFWAPDRARDPVERLLGSLSLLRWRRRESACPPWMFAATAAAGRGRPRILAPSLFARQLAVGTGIRFPQAFSGRRSLRRCCCTQCVCKHFFFFPAVATMFLPDGSIPLLSFCLLGGSMPVDVPLSLSIGMSIGLFEASLRYFC